MIKFPLLGMSDTTWTLILVGIYLVIAFMPMVLNYQYIYFSDEGENIVFRYFTAGIVGGKKNSVEINKRSFSGYKIETRFFGLDTEYYSFSEVSGRQLQNIRLFISVLFHREERSKIIQVIESVYPSGSEGYHLIT